MTSLDGCLQNQRLDSRNQLQNDRLKWRKVENVSACVASQESSERRQSLSNLSNHPRYFGYSLPLLKGRLWPYNENTSHQKLFSLTTTFPSGRDFLRTSVIRQNCDRPRNLNDLHPSSFFVERLGWLPCLCSLGLLKILPPLEPERSAHQQEPAWSRYPDWAGCIIATPWRVKASTHHT